MYLPSHLVVHQVVYHKRAADGFKSTDKKRAALDLMIQSHPICIRRPIKWCTKSGPQTVSNRQTKKGQPWIK